MVTTAKTIRKDSNLLYLVLCLVPCVLCLAQLTNTVTAATYYLDAVNGNDANTGDSTHPWKTLAKAQSTAVGGDTVYLRDGNYGDFDDSSGGSDRANWITYKAAPGHTPVFAYIDIRSRAVYLAFDGITVNSWPSNALYRSIFIYRASYVKLTNMTVIGPGLDLYKLNDGYCRGIYLSGSSYCDVNNCTISGYKSGIDTTHQSAEWFSSHCNITNNVIHDCRYGINGDGKYVNVQYNTIHDCGSDGMFVCQENSDISHNTIYNLEKSVNFTASGTFTYTASDHKIRATRGEFANWVGQSNDYLHFIMITVAGVKHGCIHIDAGRNWQDIEAAHGGAVLDANTLLLACAIPSGEWTGYTGGDLTITKVEGTGDWHNDAIQFIYYASPGYTVPNNDTFVGNKIYNIGYYPWSECDSILIGNGTDPNYEMHHLTFENNLIYNSRGQTLLVTGISTHLVFRNNTFADLLPAFITIGRYAQVDEMSGNIWNYVGVATHGEGCATIAHSAVVNYENFNLFNRRGGGWCATPGPKSVQLVPSNNETEVLFKALFNNFDANDFTLAASSLAINFCAGDANAPATDILGRSRVGAPDAGCYEYITVDPNNHAPVLETIGNKSVSENSLLSFTVSATDADSDTLTYSATNLPSGATFASHTFSWTPSYSQAGTYSVTFSVSDGRGGTDSETITITVSNTNRAPVIAAIGNKSVNENSALSFSISATDADGNTITYSYQNLLPSGAAFAGRTFTWTPGYTQAGTYQVTFIASDGQLQDSKTITITVNNVNQAPVLSAIGNKSVYATDLLAFSVGATEPDGETITYSATGLPSGATFTGQSFSWIPTPSQAGTYQVTFITSDGQLQDSEAITITVYAADTSAPTVSGLSPAADSIQAPLNSLVVLHITDSGKGVDANSVTIDVNNNRVYKDNTADYSSQYGHCRRTGTKADYAFIYQPNTTFDYDQTVTVVVNAKDLAGNTMDQYSYSSATEMRSFGKNKMVNSASDSLNKGHPATVRDIAGNIWAAWHAGPAGSREIYVGRLAAGADAFDASVQVTNSSADRYNAAIAIDASDKLYLVWQDNRRGNWDIYISTSADGTNWSAEKRVSDSNNNEVNPVIAVDHSSSPKAYIAWQDDRAGNQEIYIASSSDGFATVTTSRITSNSSDQTEPGIAVNSSNTIYVVWADSRNGTSDIYGAASNSGPWTNVPIVTKSANQTSPVIATEATGTVLHLLWVDDTAGAGNKDIYYATSNGLPTTALTGRNIVDDNTGTDQLAPAIITTGSTGAGLKVFACWQDKRNTAGGGDTDLYFVDVNSGSGTNIFVGDDATNSNQSAPAIGIDKYGYPYLVWVDDRNQNTDIYYAGSTFVRSTVLASQSVSPSSGATIGVDDVSIVIPAGAYPCELNITISKVENPPKLSVPLFSFPYEFGPSGANFDKPVTVTIPYSVSADSTASAYWYNNLAGALSQQGITDVNTIVISSTLHALRFTTTHFTQFLIGGSSGGISGGSNGGGGGGGCALSSPGQASFVEFLLPYIGLAAVMTIINRRDKRNRETRCATGNKH